MIKERILRDLSLINDLLKHVDHVIELAMDVAYDNDWLLHLEDIWFAL